MMKKVVLSIVLFCFFAFIGNCTDSLFQKGIRAFVKGDYEQAQSNFQKDISNNPSFSNYYNLGFAAGNLQDWNKAKWAFESALKYNPLNKNVQYNAEFATQKINKSQVWQNPYPIYHQIIIHFGIKTWVYLSILFSLCMGLFLYFIIKKDNKNSGLTRWSYRLFIPVVFLFILSYFCIYSINTHFNQQRFAILKSNNAKLYISPNGVEANYKVDPSLRLQIVRYNEDSTWVQLKSQKDNTVWVKQEEIYRY